MTATHTQYIIGLGERLKGTYTVTEQDDGISMVNICGSGQSYKNNKHPALSKLCYIQQSFLY